MYDCNQEFYNLIACLIHSVCVLTPWPPNVADSVTFSGNYVLCMPGRCGCKLSPPVPVTYGLQPVNTLFISGLVRVLGRITYRI